MSRPKPTIILQDYQRDLCIEICDCDGVYAVFYRGKPVKLRKHRPKDQYGGFKYGKTSFPEPGHAVALAQRLNAKFCTQDFTVVELRIGRVIPLI